MSEYIRKEDAIELCNNPLSEQSMRLVPPADVVPVVHGRWIPYRCDMYECSVCQRIHTSFDSGECDAYYCPHCGAKMDGEE